MKNISRIIKTYPLRVTTLAVFLLAVIGGGTFFLFSTSTGTASVDATARAIIAECKKLQGDHAPCYEAQVPLLYPTYSVPELFGMVQQIRAADPTYQFCHVLGHKIGEKVVAENPDAWVDAIPLNPPSGLCSNGFIHGIVGGRFRAEVLDDEHVTALLPDFTRACMPRPTWDPSNLDRAICYHGMGHLFDYITNADIPKALSLCDKVTPDGYRRVCVQGVFMQIYQPLEPDDFALIEQMKDKPTKTTVPAYCAQFTADPMAEGSCIGESWPFFRTDILAGTGVGTLCALTPNEEEARQCYISMSAIIGRLSLNTPGSATKACNAVPKEAQEICFSFSAGAVLEESRDEAGEAIELCETAPADIASQCIAGLVSRARFVFGSNEREMDAFCAAVPAHFKEECARQ